LNSLHLCFAPFNLHKVRVRRASGFLLTAFSNAQSSVPPRIAKDAQVEEAVREGLAVDKDTKGTPGSPPIFDTILKKIDQAAVFVPDLTFVGTRVDGSPTSNPDVLIEYGWALKSLGHARVVAVMNAAHGDPKSLPFDLAHHRFPATYNVADGASLDVRQEEREKLAKELETTTHLINASSPRKPLNYDDTTLRTIEQIDVLWLRGRSIVRAFEVEHTTSVYSGILRMADLLALQPNMDIKLHIVAPEAKRKKVFQEIRRPVFSLLEKGPLAENCTYLSYDSLRELAEQKHLSHLSETVLDEYAEEAE
jgi:hypothetical protein